jgi:hypothetical protein
LDNKKENLLKEYIKQNILLFENNQVKLGIDDNNYKSKNIPNENEFIKFIYPYTFTRKFFEFIDNDTSEIPIIYDLFSKYFFGIEGFENLSPELFQKCYEFISKNLYNDNSKIRRIYRGELLPQRKNGHLRLIYEIRDAEDALDYRHNPAYTQAIEIATKGMGMPPSNSGNKMKRNADILTEINENYVGNIFPWIAIDYPVKSAYGYSDGQLFPLSYINPNFIVGINGLPKTEAVSILEMK